jgi:uncharacterized glyoxalase superfamily protein PhnB
MRYRDVAAAADWLCEAFGFEKQTVLTGEDGAPVYAQLTFGRAMFMLAPVRDTPIDKLMKQPDEIGGAETQSIYLGVADADAHCARAKAAGATLIFDIDDDDFGGRTYTCRDPQGHIWTFGTYDPWQGKYPEPTIVAAPAASGGLRRALLAVATVAIVVGVGVAGWYGGALTQSGAGAVSLVAQGEPSGSGASPARTGALEAAEQAARDVRAQLERERAARVAADKASDDAQKRYAETQQARQAAERALKEVRADLERERASKVAVAGNNADVLKRVDEESRAREAAERAAKEARAELDKARADRAAAETAKDFALGRAEEEQLAREAAERAAQEARAELERSLGGAKAAAKGVDPGTQKGEAPATLDEARKLLADEQHARDAAERTIREVRAELEKERVAKASAWRVVGQLTRQLKQAQGDEPASEVVVKKGIPTPAKAKKSDAD